MFGLRGSKVFEGLAMVLAVLSLLWAGILATGTKGEWCVPALMLAGVSICCRGLGSFQKNSRGLALGFVLLFAVGVYVTWRIYSSQVTLLARYDWYLLCLLFAGLFFGRFVFDSDRRATIVVLVLVCLGLGNFVAAIWQLKVDPEWIPLSLMGFTRPLGGGGISGFYVLHNHLAGYLELVGPLILAIAVLGRAKLAIRGAWLFVYILFAILVAVSRSRFGVVAFCGGSLVVGLIGFFLNTRERGLHRAGVAVLGAVGVAGLCVLFIGLAFSQLELRGLNSMTAGLEERLGLWEMAISQWQAVPFVGAGARSFEYLCHINWPEALHFGIGNPVFAHSDWLQLLAEYGVVGFLLVSGFFFYCLIVALKSMFFMKPRRREGDEATIRSSRALAVGLLGGLCAIAVHCWFDFILHSNFNMLVTGLILGLMLRVVGDAKPMVGGRSSARLSRILCIVVGGMIVCLPSMHLRGGLLFERGRLAMGNDDSLEAQRLLNELIQLDENYYQAPLILGLDTYARALRIENRLARKSFLGSAADRLETVLELYPRNLLAIMTLAECSYQIGDKERSRELSNLAMNVAPMRMESHLAWARSLIREANDLGVSDETERSRAIELLETAADVLSKSKLAWFEETSNVERHQLIAIVRGRLSELGKRP